MGNNKIKVIADKQDLIDIADALREKTGHGKSMGIGAIVSTIRGMADADGMNTADATITSGAEMLEGVTAYGADGKVTGTIPSQEGSVITPNNQAQTAISAGTYATGTVTVSAVPTETTNITSNGVYQPATGKYFSSVNVNIPGETFETQSKTVSPTEQQQVVSPDSGYNGLSSVTVNAIASDYVGSNVPREDAKTITPTKSSQVAVSGGTYVNGDISVGAIPSEYITTTDADAIAEEIALNKTAYVDGKKVVGSFTIENEVSNQEEIISTQDEMIANIVSALEGKAAGGSGEISVITTTISEEQANWVDTLTIPELVGAKYFIIQSPYMGSFFNIDQIEDAGKIYSLIYLNGEIFSLAMFKLTMGSYGGVESIDTSTWSFDGATGTIITDQGFGKVSIDTSTNIAYKVYRLG